MIHSVQPLHSFHSLYSFSLFLFVCSYVSVFLDLWFVSHTSLIVVIVYLYATDLVVIIDLIHILTSHLNTILMCWIQWRWAIVVTITLVWWVAADLHMCDLHWSVLFKSKIIQSNRTVGSWVCFYVCAYVVFIVSSFLSSSSKSIFCVVCDEWINTARQQWRVMYWRKDTDHNDPPRFNVNSLNTSSNIRFTHHIHTYIHADSPTSWLVFFAIIIIIIYCGCCVE